MLTSLDSFCMDAPTRSVRQERPTCEPCRQRKVRCNRKIPCAHCSRLQLRCTYGQTSRRAPLRGLSKSSPVLETHTSPAESSAEPSNQPGGDPSNSEILGRLNTVETLLNNLITSLGAGKLPNIPSSNSRITHQHAPSATEPFSGGILVGDAERGSYVDDSVFVNLILDVCITILLISIKANSHRILRGERILQILQHNPHMLCLRRFIHHSLWL